MPRLLEEIDFRNPVRARSDAGWLDLLPELAVQRIATLLESVPDPDEALHYLHRFREQRPEAFDRISAAPTALRYLINTFSYSAFLSEAVLHHPEWILELCQSRDMFRVLSCEEYALSLAGCLDPSPALAPAAFVLARFRRRELLRIMLRDVLGLASLSDVTEEISNLADALLGVVYQRIHAELSARHPGCRNARMSVIALGKLGGHELNYSSDIDLMFVCSNDETPGAGLTNKEFLKQVANRCTELLSTYTSEGMCYRIDLRLRPDGRFGEIVQTLDGARAYYATRARDWELQMLIKARVAAGDPEPGQQLLAFVEPRIYSTTTDFRAVEAVSETRERIHEKLRRSPGQTLDIKLARGGIRDIEFLVQCLQRLHGGREPWVRHGGTVLALFRLRDKDLISDREYARLVSAYQFLRHLEHRLQFDEDRQTHSLPAGLDERNILARKMCGATPAANAGTLERQLDEHLEAVSELYERVILTRRPHEDPVLPVVPEHPTSAREPRAMRGEFPSANLARLLEQRTPALAQLLTAIDIGRSAERMEHFLEKIVAQPEWLHELESNPEMTRCVIDLFDHSQYFAEQLIRHPDLLSEIGAACGFKQGRTGFTAPEDLGELRRFFRRQMVRIQSDSVFHSVPVFRTLARTSSLADSVIGAAYRIALGEALRHTPPRSPAYQPDGQMMVIALGRLGMREFDLASDADLVFAIPDADSDEAAFWTSVAERLIHAITAYTGDGVIFTVDTRLRPNGRSGPLVQTEAVFKDYFSRAAEAWEGISYMKARAVAGNTDRATAFLTELQDVDWRRYGQNGRSRKQLAEMRARLEREQGGRNPLKAGPGGYYDIDFALMYLRLKGAGLFFKVLNTPERIDIVEKMGHLEREDAGFLREAATFYRALDHALRTATGHAEGTLPTSPAQLAVVDDLVNRWAPPGAGDGTLEARLAHIRTRTRRFYERVFE